MTFTTVVRGGNIIVSPCKQETNPKKDRYDKNNSMSCESLSKLSEQTEEMVSFNGKSIGRTRGTTLTTTLDLSPIIEVLSATAYGC